MTFIWNTETISTASQIDYKNKKTEQQFLNFLLFQIDYKIYWVVKTKIWQELPYILK